MRNLLFILLLSSIFGTVTDIQGNVYQTVEIGDQVWMSENLKTTQFNNGENIPSISANGTSSGASPYDNDISNSDTYGMLYNWYAVNDNNGICPEGWHAPTDEEFMELEMELGMYESEASQEDWRGDLSGVDLNVGGQLKSTTDDWFQNNNGATNESGFTALPGGMRPYNNTGQDIAMGNSAFIWTSGEVDWQYGWYRQIYFGYTTIKRDFVQKNSGKSVRCLADEIIQGCINELACNYNEEANTDDDSCLENDCAGTCGGTAVIDVCDVCNGPGYAIGDSNNDCSLDVLDIVAMIDYIISGTTFDYDADLTGEGDVNVLDVVALVSIIVDGGIARISDADSATMIISNNSVSLSADGYIGGVQMTLTHGQGFTLDLTDDAMFAEYKISGTSTILIIVEPQDELLFTTNESFEIIEMIVANSIEEINVDVVSDFVLTRAYPNPFNPSTTISLTLPSAEYVSVKVYNLMGQVVGVLADGMMEANVYAFTWEASNISSGVYLIKAESSSSVDVQKVLLIK